MLWQVLEKWCLRCLRLPDSFNYKGKYAVLYISLRYINCDQIENLLTELPPQYIIYKKQSLHMEDQGMEAATPNPKGSHKDTHPPQKGPRGHTTKPNKQTEISAKQKTLLTLTNDIQTALATHQACKIPEVQSLLPILQRAHACLSYQA
ncbi:hypothetical protein M433DRAFT_504686 [Acidomyces richmondensis BFW]|nr:hypothetical protein M433DRAFT_504686 [Acidomyces richmondensis BFW]